MRRLMLSIAILILMSVSTLPMLTATAYADAPGTWSSTGSMTTGREYQAATLLSDGKVLVTGGINESYPTSSPFYTASTAELYDPSTGMWSATGSMHVGRTSHTATLLSNGKVLVAGGSTNGNINSGTTSAELYDPSSGTWTVTGSMNIGREYHTATLLQDGSVLVTGGCGGNDCASAEVYDPSSGTWTLTNSMTTSRAYHTATLLPNGKVLVAGGGICTNSGCVAGLDSAELYDPNSGTWTTTGSMTVSRHFHTATLLPTGKVLVVGGGPSGALASAELYNPSTGTWTLTGSMSTARELHTATLLTDGQVLVAGGRDCPQHCGSLASSEIYDESTGAWTATGSMANARYGQTATLLSNGNVLVAGGIGPNSYPSTLSSAELYEPVITVNCSGNSCSNSGTATPELSSGELLATGLLPIGGVLLYRRRRTRRAMQENDGTTI